MSALLQLPRRVNFGPGALEQVGEIIERNKAKKVLVFTGKSIRKLGVTAGLEAAIVKTGAFLEIVDEIPPEPSVEDVEKALASVKDFQVDLLIAIGGGSVLDTAKLVAVLLGAPYKVRDLLQNPLQAKKQFPTVMIPTTCGTGSEATCNAIVAIPEEQVKKGIVSPALIPDEVILDVNCVAALPKSIIAATGVDALAHCVECYTSKKATPLSDLYASVGAKLIFLNIEKAYNHGDKEALQNLLLGAFYGGVAITGSGTTAVHALSYPLGGRYHIAHGVSNAILFAQVMTFNKDVCTDRLAALCDTVYPQHGAETNEKKADVLIQRISGIVKNTEIPVSLKAFGLKEADLEDLVLAGSQQTRLLVNNMKELSLDDIRSIYRQVI
ncbi:iron-containing alcohol dehydrogenase [Treponema primitia]|uniref:iron-containing alcohol dehydrogenase n=1 Tax=Treponema primitia TaxID=88058 RepID=UPI00397FE761